MATVSGTLKLFDAISGPLRQITNSMNITISVMNQMNSATTNNAQVSRQLTAAQRELASAEAFLRTSADQATQAQNRLNNSARSGVSLMGKLSMGIITANQGLELMRKLYDSITKTMTFADGITSANARLMLVNDGLRTQLELQKQVLKVANDTQTSYQATADTVSKIGLFTQGLFKNNNEMLDFTKSLNQALSIGGGDQVNKDAALLQLNQSLASGRLQGDEFRSIAENAPMFMEVLTRHLDIGRGKLRELSSEGKLTSDVIVAAFKSQSEYIQKTFNSMPMTFGGAMTIIKNKWVEFVGYLNQAGGPLTRLTDQLKIFIAWLETDSASQFFNNLYIGISWAVNGFILLVNIVTKVISFFSYLFNLAVQYWPIILAGLSILVTMYLPVIISFLNIMIAKLWLMIEPIVTAAASWLIMNWPILLVIGLVIALIAILNHFGISTEQILGFVGGLFYGLGATVWNIVANMWNWFAMFAEFLINLFIDPTYAIKKLFYDLVMMVVNNMTAMAGSFDTAANVLANVFVTGANIAIGAINGLIAALNMIPGVDIGEVSKVNPGAVSSLSNAVKNFANNLEAPTSSKNVVSIPRAQLKSIPDAVSKGYSAGAKLANTNLTSTLKNAMNSINTPESVASDFGKGIDGSGAGKTPDIGKVGKVGSVGKIDDTVDISSEDLKMMRELAEMKSIQNFVTLTPTLQVQTGDIRETADIQELIAKLEQMLAEQIAESAKGVYS